MDGLIAEFVESACVVIDACAQLVSHLVALVKCVGALWLEV